MPLPAPSSWAALLRWVLWAAPQSWQAVDKVTHNLTRRMDQTKLIVRTTIECGRSVCSETNIPLHEEQECATGDSVVTVPLLVYHGWHREYWSASENMRTLSCVASCWVRQQVPAGPCTTTQYCCAEAVDVDWLARKVPPMPSH